MGRDDSTEFFQKKSGQTKKPEEINEFKVPLASDRYRKSHKKAAKRYVDDKSDRRTTPKPVNKILIKKRKGQNSNESVNVFYISEQPVSLDTAQPNVELKKKTTTGVSGLRQDIRSKALDAEIAKRFKDLFDFITSEYYYKKKRSAKTKGG